MKNLFMLAVRCEVLKTWAFKESSEILQSGTRNLLADAGIKAKVYPAYLASNLNCAAVAVEVESEDYGTVINAALMLKKLWQVRYIVLPNCETDDKKSARMCDYLVCRYEDKEDKKVLFVTRKLQAPLAKMRLNQKLHPQVWVYEREDGVHFYALSHPLHDQNRMQWQKHIGELLQASGFEAPRFSCAYVSVL